MRSKVPRTGNFTSERTRSSFETTGKELDDEGKDSPLTNAGNGVKESSPKADPAVFGSWDTNRSVAC